VHHRRVRPRRARDARVHRRLGFPHRLRDRYAGDALATYVGASSMAAARCTAEAHRGGSHARCGS
jgi:hypothetical protein